ncbi:MAG: hypothetical protein GY777_08235 [Candidatus Brocadiaceae bacterium]|nr:hypothetical protein [Candidatus Brocadiaceae bacterium]
MHNKYYGAIAVKETERDFQLGSSVEIPRAPSTFLDHKIEYNQKEVSSVSCTVHGAIGAVSDLTGYRFSLDERKEIWNKALALGADPNVGWYVRDAVHLVYEYYNQKQPLKPVRYFRTDMWSPNCAKMLLKGYTGVMGHRGNSTYNKDVSEDGMLDNIIFGETTYGHCLRFTEAELDPYYSLVNNYVGKTYNVYKVPISHIKPLLSNDVFFRSVYFYVLDYEDMDAQVPIWAKESFEKAVNRGIINASDDLTKIVMDGVEEERLLKLGVLTEKEGNVSLLRWIVVLDRLNQL